MKIIRINDSATGFDLYKLLSEIDEDTLVEARFAEGIKYVGNTGFLHSVYITPAGYIAVKIVNKI